VFSYLLSSPGSAALLVSSFATRQVVQKWRATNIKTNKILTSGVSGGLRQAIVGSLWEALVVG